MNDREINNDSHLMHLIGSQGKEMLDRELQIMFSTNLFPCS